MPPALRLSILPLVGLAFLAAAYAWSQRELKLRLLGTPAEGRIVGMALQRADHADLLAGLDTELVLTLANGDRVETRHADHAPVSVVLHPADAASPAQTLPLSALADVSTGTADFTFTPELRRVLNDAVAGEATIIRWALQREERRPEDPRRVVRIEKTETVRGWFGLPALPEVFDYREGRAHLDDATSASKAGLVRIRAVFDRRDPVAVKAAKGETLVDYTYERNGEAVTPAKKNFFLAAEPYATEFRPVFAYESGGRGVARLSHIGRHGGPTLALRLFQPCRVYFDPADPEQAIVTAVPGPMEGKPLEWFSRLCEGIFAQWGATALIALAGSMFIVVGLLFASLVVFPPKKLHLAEQEV